MIVDDDVTLVTNHQALAMLCLLNGGELRVSANDIAKIDIPQYQLRSYVEPSTGDLVIKTTPVTI